jgi:hypothetical protein
MKKLGIGMMMMSLISTAAFAEVDLCQDPQQAANATQALEQIRSQLSSEAPSLSDLVSSSGIGTCNSESIYSAALQPGQMAPAIAYDICGAVLTFANSNDMNTVATWLVDHSSSSNLACVSINVGSPQ